MRPRQHNHSRRRPPPPLMSSLPPPPPPPPPPAAVSSPALQPSSAQDCNLAALCEHIQTEGFGSGEFSDVQVEAMGCSYNLHRLILSRSAYFRNMLHGPWKEAGAPTVILQIDDPNVNSEAISISLAYLYGQTPKLNDSNAFRVLAAASFLDIQDLCAICTDFIIAELWTSNFLQYQVFAESQDYGIYGERVRSACWGYLCQSATMELRNLLPKLSSQTLHALITSDELWVPNEEKRLELALCTLLAKGAISDEEETESSDSTQKGKNVINSGSSEQSLESELIHMHINDNLGSNKSAQNDLINLADCMAEFQSGVSFSNLVLNDSEPTKRNPNDSSSSGPSASCENNNNNNNNSSWGNNSNNRTVGRRKVKNTPAKEGSCLLPSDEYEAFMNIFEGGSLLYCNMSFEALLNARKQLEELGFPCKALNDGLWLQMLLCHRVQAVVLDTCRNCCLTSNSCACRQNYGFTHGSVNYYRQDQSSSPGSSNNNSNSNNNVGNIYLPEAQGDGAVLFGPTRVHRGASDGLAGIGRGSSPTSNNPSAWAPTRYVFSRIPVGGSESSHAADVSDGLTVLVGLTDARPGGGVVGPAGLDRGFGGGEEQRMDVDGGGEEGDESEEWGGSEGSNGSGSLISLDFKTPLSHFPPFRFGVEFEEVLRLTDGQVKHSSEVFYAGSLWKVSVQAFNDEDPQGRRTLGLFLHRRKAEVTDPLRKAHIYIDSREKVTARYQLICPSKREVMVFGSLKQAGTLLPKAPKGWGWRTALLFDELADLLQAGSLRIAAIVQLV
ncbi:hypothetical protein LUZ60_003578 [Juncus effusus]|nr:hypothetical protein LUZ60_003578 [Juncus effusus]